MFRLLPDFQLTVASYCSKEFLLSYPQVCEVCRVVLILQGISVVACATSVHVSVYTSKVFSIKTGI